MKLKTRLHRLCAVALFPGLAVAWPISGQAAARSSASYSLPADTLDAGGQRIASAAYTMDGSVGGLGGIGVVASPELAVKQGYVGQLYEVTGLSVSANSTNVDEGASRQISAVATFDDATFANLAAATVSWTVQNGPINSISADGVATAGVVYQTTPATVQGRYRGQFATLDLLVLDVDDDNFDAYAADGVDDAWQVEYFGLNHLQAGAAADPDGDGQTNRFEYMAGTLPTDFFSRFRLSIEDVVNQPAHKNIIFSPRHPTRSYNVEYCPGFGTVPFAPLTNAATNDSGSIRTVTDLDASESARIYRVQISYP